MVIRFSLSSLPQNISVTSASLSLFCILDESPSVGASGEIARLAKPWSDAYATWTMADSAIPWNSSGGDIDMSTLKTIYRTQSDITGQWETIDVTGYIKAGILDSNLNTGFWILVAHGDGHRYCSSEYADSSLRPKLILNTDSTNGIERAPDLEKGTFIRFVDSRQADLFVKSAGEFDFRVLELNGKILYHFEGISMAAEEHILNFSRVFQSLGSRPAIAVLRSGKTIVSKSFIHLR